MSHRFLRARSVASALAALALLGTASSQAAAADTQLPTAPGQPTVTSVVPTPGSPDRYTLSWTPSTDNVRVVSYNVLTFGTVGATVTADNRNYGVDVYPDSGYSVAVQAVDAAGNVSASSPAAVRDGYFLLPNTGTPPATPGVPVRQGVSPDGVVISWGRSQWSYFRAPSYSLYDGATLVLSTYDVTSATLPASYTPTSPYALTVVAVDHYGNRSAPSPVLTFPEAPADTTPPTAPGQPAVTGSTPSTVSVAWAAATDDRGVAGYDVYVGSNKLASTSGALSAVLPIHPPADDEVYVVTVKARDAAGNESAASPALTFRGDPVPPKAYAFTVAGNAQLKSRTTGPVRLSGNLSLQTDPLLGVGASGQLTLNAATAKLTALGFLPVIANVAFSGSPSAATPLSITGSINGGVAQLSTKARVKVTSATLLGVKLVTTASCQAAAPSTIALTSAPGLSPQAPSSLSGTFAIGTLAGCGSLNGLVSSLFAGNGNTIALRLTPTA